MQKRSSKQGLKDRNETALRIVDEAIGEMIPEQGREKNPHAVALGSAGGKVGGRARALKLTAEERSAIARKAAMSRWHDIR
jgi:hypothetical protein